MTPRRGRELLLGALLVLVTSLPTLRTIAGGPSFVVGSSGDLAHFVLPIARAWRDAGRPPLWKPGQYFGQPTVGDPPQRVLYPPMLVYAALPLPLAHHVYLLLHGWVLALGTYALARSERRSPLASFLAGVAMGLSFKAIAYQLAAWDAVYGAVAWVPLAVLFFRRAQRRGHPRAVVPLAACLALSALAGIPQFVAGLGLVLPPAHLLALGPRRTGRRLARLLVSTAVAFGLAGLLAAPALLPAFEMNRASERADVDGAYGTVLSPDLVGQLALPCFARADFSWEYANGLGVLALPLAGAGFVARRGRVPLGAWILVLSLVLAGGHETFLGRAIARIPLVGSFSYATRMTWLSALGVVLLAASGLDALARGRGSRRLALGLVGGALVLAVGLATPGRAAAMGLARVGLSPGGATLVLAAAGVLALAPLAALATSRRRTLLGGLVALTAAELLGTTELASERVPASTFEPATPIARALESEPLARVAVVTSHFWQDPVLPLYEAPRVERADGYNPLHPRDAARFLRAIAPLDLDERFRRYSPFHWLLRVDRVDLLRVGVTHVVAREALAGFEVVARDDSPVYAGTAEWVRAPRYLCRVPGALPRAFVATRARSVPRDRQIEALLAARFDGSRQVLVDDAVPPGLEGERPIEPASVVRHEPERVVLGADVPGPLGGWVVLLDADGPGWSATVDGAPAAIVRADGIFSAVRVGPGRHEVVLRAGLPASFLAGAILGGAGAVLALAVLVVRPGAGPDRRAR